MAGIYPNGEDAAGVAHLPQLGVSWQPSAHQGAGHPQPQGRQIPAPGEGTRGIAQTSGASSICCPNPCILSKAKSFFAEQDPLHPISSIPRADHLNWEPTATSLPSPSPCCPPAPSLGSWGYRAQPGLGKTLPKFQTGVGDHSILGSQNIGVTALWGQGMLGLQHTGVTEYWGHSILGSQHVGVTAHWGHRILGSQYTGVTAH